MINQKEWQAKDQTRIKIVRDQNYDCKGKEKHMQEELKRRMLRQIKNSTKDYQATWHFNRRNLTKEQEENLRWLNAKKIKDESKQSEWT